VTAPPPFFTSSTHSLLGHNLLVWSTLRFYPPTSLLGRFPPSPSFRCIPTSYHRPRHDIRTVPPTRSSHFLREGSYPIFFFSPNRSSLTSIRWLLTHFPSIHFSSLLLLGAQPASLLLLRCFRCFGRIFPLVSLSYPEAHFPLPLPISPSLMASTFPCPSFPRGELVAPTTNFVLGWGGGGGVLCALPLPVRHSTTCCRSLPLELLLFQSTSSFLPVGKLASFFSSSSLLSSSVFLTPVHVRLFRFFIFLLC